MGTKRVLFVDDEPLVLKALKLMLRCKREWELVFVESAEAALDELQRAPFDVIVSDLRMPRTDGAQLLQIVVNRWPAIGRLVLSGNASDELLTRARALAHRCLSKPCERGDLIAAIEGLHGEAT